MAEQEFESFEEVADVTDEDLVGVADLAHLQVAKEKEVTLLEAQLKRAKAELRKVAEIDLPDMMAQIRLSEIVLQDGQSITIKEDMYATVAKKNKKAAAQWMIDNGQKAIVQNSVSYGFDKGDLDKLQHLTTLLDSSGYDQYSISETMNTGSVKAVIKELLAQGVDVPLELFGAHFVKRAIVK